MHKIEFYMLVNAEPDLHIWGPYARQLWGPCLRASDLPSFTIKITIELTENS